MTIKIKDLEDKLPEVDVNGGGGSEDWTEGYELSLKNMNWRKGIKLIINICDDVAHGEHFTPKDPFFAE